MFGTFVVVQPTNRQTNEQTPLRRVQTELKLLNWSICDEPHCFSTGLFTSVQFSHTIQYNTIQWKVCTQKL